MAKRPHVALLVETSIRYGREVLQGVTRYLRSHPPWSVFLEQQELFASPPRWLRNWRGDGVICRKTSPELARVLGRAGVPVVDLTDTNPAPGLPRIESDHRAIGGLAAQHLLERGFTRFAFCGFGDQAWSVGRRAGFLARLGERGHGPGACDVWESPRTGPRADPWEREQDQIVRWLRSLPRPVGIMACNDMRGQHVLDACQRIDLAVPEEAAVVGVDDDALLCNLCHPPALQRHPQRRAGRVRGRRPAGPADGGRAAAARAAADRAARRAGAAVHRRAGDRRPGPWRRSCGSSASARARGVR